MKKLLFTLAAVALFSVTACNDTSEEVIEEVQVEDADSGRGMLMDLDEYAL